MPVVLSDDQNAEVVQLSNQGLSQKEIAEKTGISSSQISRILTGKSKRWNNIASEQAAKGVYRDALDPKQWSREAKRAANDFEYFRRRYLGHISRPWQVALAEHIRLKFESADPHERHYLVANMPPGGGKALALNTPIATPTGWSTMKDLEVGDQVFDDQGKPCTVTYKSEVFYNHDCYEVSTDDGHNVIADADHLWPVRASGYGTYKWKAKPDYKGKTGPKARSVEGVLNQTSEFISRPRSKKLQLALTAPLELPEAELPIDPYVLGVWLGDGNSAGSRLTCCAEDAPHISSHIRAAGYTVEQKGPITYSITGSKKWTRDGLATQLRATDLLNKKNIPEAYLRASRDQRLALLQGLIDTDGYVSERGLVEFTSTRRVLAEGALHLAHSLGAKATLSEGRATIDGRDCGPKYRVRFYLANAARLPRKADRCIKGTRPRYLTAVKVESVPTQCIQVDSPNHLYLAGRGLMVTHNTTLLRDICCWLIVRNRHVRILWGSRTQRQAEENVELIRNILESPVAVEVSEGDKLRRHAVDPIAVLSIDYGRFRPSKAGSWGTEGFKVALPGGAVGSQKENTMSAFGMDSGSLGQRVDLAVWDDLVDIKNYYSEGSRDKLKRWYDTQAENRIEPGGLHVLLGQRLSPDDLYRHCLDKQAVQFDDNGEEIEDAEGLGRMYEHIVYPAHNEELCQGVHAPRLAKAWPDGCLLDPTALSWQKLRSEEVKDSAMYRVVYQQEDLDPTSALVRRVWIDGGTDTDGTTYMGAWDDHRAPWTHPGAPGTYWTTLTIDPSGEKLWAVQLWAYNQQSKYRFLIAAHAGRMTAPELLEGNPGGGWSGLLYDWTVRARQIRLAPNAIIIENNAAQRYLLQYEFFRRFCSAHNILSIAHKTNGTTKLDPDRGVETLRTPWKHQQIRLPGTPTGRQMSARLVREATSYPMGGTTDQLMAEWFFEFWLPTHGKPRVEQHTRPDRPSWLNGDSRRAVLKAVS